MYYNSTYLTIVIS